MRQTDLPDSLTGATAIVLAGGRSSRMGQAKALLCFDGEPLIARIVTTLNRLFGDIVVVASPDQELPPMPVTLVRDDVAFQGPVSGICTGLRAARREICFVSACDAAFLNTSLVAHLVARLADCDVVVPSWQGRLQPLHAVYRRRVLPLLERQLARGELRPVSLFDRVRTLQIDEDEIRRFDPEGASFFNMNSPDDYAEALKRSSAHVHCTVELFGVAGMLSGVREVALTLPPGATVSQVLVALAARVPALSGRVITPDGTQLVDGYACNVNGRDFVRSTAAAIQQGDRLLILSADAGG